jgi:hypothetical protein
MDSLPNLARIIVALIIVSGLTLLLVAFASSQYKQGTEWILLALASWGAFDYIATIFKWLMKGIE